jgi:hypothetical protein
MSNALRYSLWMALMLTGLVAMGVAIQSGSDGDTTAAVAWCCAGWICAHSATEQREKIEATWESEEGR